MASVVDLFVRQVAGWSMNPLMSTGLVMNAVLMTSWKRRPAQEVLIPYDQESQYTSREWRDFLVGHQTRASMSRFGYCHDNPVAERFFSLLQTPRVNRIIYQDRNAARRDNFD
ncbi:DDE-type integrase/transposase/recombinase [Marinobacter sp. F4206]|nr:DDE-type integrase/transposase/recombinase [Marinobacter sp. F4206]